MAEVTPTTPRSGSPTRRSSSASAGKNTSSDEAKELTKQRYNSPFDASFAVARKRVQHERLWEIFTTYALQISSEDPTRIRVTNIVRLLQDCGIIDGDNTEQAKMVETEVIIVCEGFLKNHPTDRDSSKKLDFTAFLALLMHFAKMSGDEDPNRAYDSLIRTCLEKQQKARIRVVVTEELKACKKVLAAFEDPLTKIFSYYATQSHSKLEKIDIKMAQHSPAHMGYAEAVAYGRKYGIIAHGVLTTTEFATIYIDSLPKNPASEYDRVLTYSGFCEMLVQLSMKTCLDKALPVDQNLKGLLQLMWLALASKSPRALQITDLLKSDRVDVTKHFLIHFEKYWKKEGYANYFGDRPAVANPPPRLFLPRRQSMHAETSNTTSKLSRRLSVPAPAPLDN